MIDKSLDSIQYKSLTCAELQLGISALSEVDKALDMQLRRLDSQAQACRAEIEAVRKILGRNIESSFKPMDDSSQPKLPSLMGIESPTSDPEPKTTGITGLVQRENNLRVSLANHETVMSYMEQKKIMLANATNQLYNQMSHLDPNGKPSHDTVWADEKEKFDNWIQSLLQQCGVVASGPSQAIGDFGLQNTKTEKTEPADVEFMPRRRSMSELSNASDKSSVASIADSIFSILSESSISSVVGPTGAGERLVALLLNDSDLLVLYREALNRITPDRFERNLRRLLKHFAIELRKEAESPQQRSAAHFVRYRARNSAHVIRNSFYSLEKPQVDNIPVLDVEVLAQEQVDAESDESENDSEPDHEDLTDLQQLERFIVTSQAFIKLRNDLSSFIYHTDQIGKQTFRKQLDSRANP